MKAKYRTYLITACATCAFAAYSLYTYMAGYMNQRAAMVTVAQVLRAEEAFSKGVGNGKYGDLEKLSMAGLIPKELNDREYKGFHYEIKVNENSFSIIARPLRRSFLGFWGTGRSVIAVDNTGKMRLED